MDRIRIPLARRATFRMTCVAVVVLGCSLFAWGQANPCGDPPVRRRNTLLSPLANGQRDHDKFVTTLARDSRNRIWVGTEDQGVWYYDPAAPRDAQWQGFGVRDGLGDDNAYAVVCDPMGRVWVGTLNHGVAVYNGETWKNYDALSGPLGERIFALAVNPRDGDVWIASNAGLTRYSQHKDVWTHYTRSEGLPSDQAGSLAFSQDGTLYVGTHCDGIAVGSPEDDYATWRVVRAPREYRYRVPLVPKGEGLPTDMINSVLVTRDDTVYAATTTGLAWSRDHGRTWQFTRGADWGDKVCGLKGGAPDGWEESEGAEMAADYLTTLAEDAAGRLWVGTRQDGYETVDPRTGKHRRPNDVQNASDGGDVFVSAILPQKGQPALIGKYQGGLVNLSPVFGAPDGSAADAATAQAEPVAPFPTPAQAPGLTELRQMLDDLNRLYSSETGAVSAVVTLPSDWSTCGDWQGRYGRYWMCFCALHAPMDFIWGTGAENVQYRVGVGPNRDDHDGMRFWIHWDYTDNPRCLEIPPTYLDCQVRKHRTSRSANRRQAEWNDNGMSYPTEKDGPHLYCHLTVPEGVFVLSLYNMNKDGHQNKNRLRDYRVSIRDQVPGKPVFELDDFAERPELAHARCRDFWGGEYLRFLVRGPRQLTIQVDRNYSFNAMVTGLMLDRDEEYPEPYFGPIDATNRLPQGVSGGVTPGAGDRPGTVLVPEDARLADAIRCLLEKIETERPGLLGGGGRRYYASLARWYQAALLRPAVVPDRDGRSALATCYYRLQHYAQWEEQQEALGLTTARAIEHALRWDGRSDTSLREDRELVLAYRAAHPSTANDLAR